MKLRLHHSTYTALLLMSVLLFWSSTYICIKLSLGLGDDASQLHTYFSAGPLALFRAIVASATLLLLNLCSKSTRLYKKTPLTKKEITLLFLLGLLGFAIYYLALNLTQLTIPANVIGFIASQTPILTAVLAILIIKERITLRSWLGISIGSLGLTLIFFSSPNRFTTLDHTIWVFIALACSSSYLILQKILLTKLTPLKLISFAMWIGTGCLLPFLPQLIEQIMTASWQTIALVIYLGIFPSAVADVLWGIVLTRLPLAKAMVFYYAFPFMTMLLAFWLLKENPNSLLIAGGTTAFVGATLFNFYKMGELKAKINQPN